MSVLEVDMASSNNKMSIETYKVNLFYLLVLRYTYILELDFIMVFNLALFASSFVRTCKLFMSSCTTSLTKGSIYNNTTLK